MFTRHFFLRVFVLISSVTLCAAQTPNVPTEQTSFSPTSISIDTIPLDLEQEQQFKTLEDLNKATKAPACDEENAATYLGFLTRDNSQLGFPTIEIQNILKTNFYEKTNPPVIRSIHDLPLISAHILRSNYENGISIAATPFFNTTNRMFYTEHSDKILAYIALLSSKDFLGKIDQLDFTKIDIADVLSIFQQMSLVERRFGVMASAWGSWNHWTVSAALPLYWNEHNLFLTDAEQERVMNQPLFTGVGTVLPGLDFDTFRERHFINDKLGMGDLRLQLLYNFAGDQCPPVRIGGQITFPTAAKFKEGIIGGHFCKTSPFPLIDYMKTFDLYGEIAALSPEKKRAQLELSELWISYGLEAIDRLAGNLIDLPMGEQHVNLGPLFHLEPSLSPHGTIGLVLDGELKFTLPAHEIRLFRTKKNGLNFDRDYLEQTQLCENMRFLDEQSSHFLYPTPVRISTRPGIIAKASAALLAQVHESVQLTVGYDFWGQTREHLGKISCVFAPLDFAPQQLDLAAGTKHKAYEGKIFAGILGKICTKDFFPVHIGLQGDATVHNHGIGKSYTVGMHIGIDF